LVLFGNRQIGPGPEQHAGDPALFVQEQREVQRAALATSHKDRFRGRLELRRLKLVDLPELGRNLHTEERPAPLHRERIQHRFVEVLSHAFVIRRVDRLHHAAGDLAE
jgi:hypothetical protein